MWSRVVEIMLGIWLLISPFVFGHPAEQWQLWTNDIAAGGLVILCGLLSHWRPTRSAHLVTFVIGVWLIAFAFATAYEEPTPAAQNVAILGLLLLMFAMIPNEASSPPESWDRRTAEPSAHSRT